MKKLSELYSGPRGDRRDAKKNTDECSGAREHTFLIPGFRDWRGKMLRINILAMGDVGGTLALAMKLTGSDIVSEIGICDISETVLARWEQELNQIALPRDLDAFSLVRPVPAERLFDCDVFVFCASRGVPDVSQTDVDVRMVQLEKNMELVRSYAETAVKAEFDGEFFIVSDPVDPLCYGAMSVGIRPERIQGFGLGVMNGRAAYFARQAMEHAAVAEDPQQEDQDRKKELYRKMAKYLTEGRVFGPHGEDLVVANSIFDYDEEASLELTRRTVEANLRIRELGYKPYIAPAVTSGALSILENLRGNWHYSSAWFGGSIGPDCAAYEGASGPAVQGAFLGMRNRRCEEGLLIEDLPLDERLFARIERACRNLEQIR